MIIIPYNQQIVTITLSILLVRYETTTTTSNTQQSIKKNINDLDNLLNNLSTHRLVG